MGKVKNSKEIKNINLLSGFITFPRIVFISLFDSSLKVTIFLEQTKNIVSKIEL